MQKHKRLLQMSPWEIAFRLREQCYTESERFFGLSTGARSAPWSFKTYLAGEPSARFYAGARSDLRQLFREELPGRTESAKRDAEELCRHEARILNCSPVQLGEEIDWNRDPITGEAWERRFWADHHPEHDPKGRDSKQVHELNRHQHLPRLAKAWRLSGEERFAAEAIAQMLSWIDQNPIHQTINWQSSLEIAIRTTSWLWTIFLLQDSESFDATSAQTIGDSLFAQLEHVSRHLSTYSSPNTHLIGEASALFIAGLVFRDVRRASRWLRRAAAILTSEAETQILSDGVHGELSSYYHCYTLDFYLQVLILADQNRFALPSLLRERVSGMLRFLVHITRPDGSIPLLGDDDGGRALALASTTYRSFRDGICMGAILWGRGDWKRHADGFAEESLWLFGPRGFDIYRCLDSASLPAESQANFPQAGYSIQRNGWGSGASHLIFDSGGLGLSKGGHAHADGLSLSLFGLGRELLADPGTFVYNGSPEWRQYFRSTRAHNTVSVDGRDQAESGGTFRWNTRWNTFQGLQREAAGLQYVEAQHDAYLTPRDAVIHRRRLLNILDEYWLVVDDFSGSGQHTFGFSYQLGRVVNGSGLDIRPDGFLLDDGDGFTLGFTASGAVATECLTGSIAPIAGWTSRGYGVKQPATSLHAKMRSLTPVAAISFLAPGQSKSVLSTTPAVAGNALACSYRHSVYEDLAVFCWGDAPVRIGDFVMEGEFFWLRKQAGELARVVAIRAHKLYESGQKVFHHAGCQPFYAAQHRLAAKGDESLCVASAAS